MYKFLLIFAVLPLLISHGFQIQPRIINGIRSRTGKYPFFVQISGETVESNYAAAICGASLLSDRWIVTAAHCVEEEMDKYIASFGIDRNGMYEMHVEIERSNIYIFPERSIFSDDRDDIALLKLSNPIELSAAIQPIKLPSDCGENISNLMYAIAVGNGLTTKPWTDGLLRETMLVTLSSDKCANADMADQRAVIYTRSTLPYGTTAIGDSGGPLMRFSDKTLIGVLSMKGPEPDNVIEPRIQLSTNIYYYFDWISEMTGMELPKCDSLHN